MVENNEHLLNPTTGYLSGNKNRAYQGRYVKSKYDTDKLPIMDEKNKTLKGISKIIPYHMTGSWLRDVDLGILNATITHSFTLGLETRMNLDLNNHMFLAGQGWSSKPIEEAVCEETGNEGAIQTHTLVAPFFSFRDYINELDLEDGEAEKAWFKGLFEWETEKKDNNEYVTKFRVIPEKTPFLTDEQRTFMEGSLPVKSVKSKRIHQSTKRQLNEYMSSWFRGRTSGQGSTYGLPPLIKVDNNFVQVHLIADSEYDERKDTISYTYDTKVVNTDQVEGLRKKSSPNYQRYILDRKDWNAIHHAVKDYHANACRVCGKRDHTAKNCTIWDDTTKAFKEAYDDKTTTGRALSFEFTMFERPCAENETVWADYGRQHTGKYIPYSRTKKGQAMKKIEVSMRDARKNMATLMLWGDQAVEFADWMNNRTLGKGWKDKDLKQQVDDWYAIKGGGTDRLTDDRLIFYIHDGWVKRGSSYRTGKPYGGSDAYTKTISVNPDKGAYLEYTGEEYEFVPSDERSNIDDLYKRVKKGKKQRLIG